MGTHQRFVKKKKKKSMSQEPSKKATKKAKKGRNLMAEFSDNEYGSTFV